MKICISNNWEIESLLISGVTIFLIIVGKYIHKLFPGALLVLVAGSIYSHLSDYKGPVVGEIPTGIPDLGFGLPWGSVDELFLSGIDPYNCFSFWSPVLHCLSHLICKNKRCVVTLRSPV